MLPVQHQIKNLKRPGLIAAMCRELKIADYSDVRITNAPDARNVTIGQVVVAMTINGLGFTGQTLYIFTEFFKKSCGLVFHCANIFSFYHKRQMSGIMKDLPNQKSNRACATAE